MSSSQHSASPTVGTCQAFVESMKKWVSEHIAKDCEWESTSFSWMVLPTSWPCWNHPIRGHISQKEPLIIHCESPAYLSVKISMGGSHETFFSDGFLNTLFFFFFFWLAYKVYWGIMLMLVSLQPHPTEDWIYFSKTKLSFNLVSLWHFPFQAHEGCFCRGRGLGKSFTAGCTSRLGGVTLRTPAFN